MAVIFLAGVHGVGKTFLGGPVAIELGLQHFSASQLIKEERGQATWGQDKNTSAIDDNQILLVRALNRKRSLSLDILLDGHFVLKNSEGKFVELEVSVFQQLGLNAIILLSTEAEIIRERLYTRDQSRPSISSIEEFILAEERHAGKVAKNLNIPLFKLFSPSLEMLRDTISQVLHN